MDVDKILPFSSTLGWHSLKVKGEVQTRKGLRWIPRHPETRKGVVSDEMLRGVENKHRSGTCFNRCLSHRTRIITKVTMVNRINAYSLIILLIFLLLVLTTLLIFIVKRVHYLRNLKSDIKVKELVLVFLTFLAPPIAAVLIVKKVPSFCLFFLERILNSVIGAGLFCGFLTTLTVGFGYFFVVASFFFQDNQRRVAAMTGFATGQLIMFASVYNKPLHQGLVQPERIILLFLGSFFVQVFWTSRKTLNNEEFLDPDDLLIIQRRRVLRLQLEFLLSFFVQICNPYLEPDSLIPRLVNFCIVGYKNDTVKTVFFLRSSFAGWFIGHILNLIFFIKLFEFVVIITLWVRKNFFDQ